MPERKHSTMMEARRVCVPRKAAPPLRSRKPVWRRMLLRFTRRCRFRLAAGEVPCSKNVVWI